MRLTQYFMHATLALCLASASTISLAQMQPNIPSFTQNERPFTEKELQRYITVATQMAKTKNNPNQDPSQIMAAVNRSGLSMQRINYINFKTHFGLVQLRDPERAAKVGGQVQSMNMKPNSAEQALIVKYRSQLEPLIFD